MSATDDKSTWQSGRIVWNREEPNAATRQVAIDAAWSQFQKMPASNPSDYAHAIVAALGGAMDAKNKPTAPPADLLAAHRWYTTRWGDGGGGYNWRCACGTNDNGNASENPERYKRYGSEASASEAAVSHIAYLSAGAIA